MNEEPEEPQAGEPEPPKIKAEDNRWYLLATLYGMPGPSDSGLKEKNRTTWNRYFAVNVDEEKRTKLIEEKRFTADELKLLSPGELQDVAKAFAERCKALSKEFALPPPGADIDFSGVEFDQKVSFDGYFLQNCSFKRSIFSGDAYFSGVTFFWAYFDDAIFRRRASFVRASFERGSFVRATFTDSASFDCATFFEQAKFDGAKFFCLAYFGGATFHRRAYSSFVILASFASFADATFFGQADFEGAMFSGQTNFGATFGKATSFENAEMKGETSFEHAKFLTKPPRFFGAKLHQGTVWRDIEWPPEPKDKEEAGRFIDAYACLKLEMDRLKKHEDELDFFALELQSRSVLVGPVRGLPIALYGLLSEYGRSYLRPLVALFVAAAIGAGAFWYFDARTIEEALGLGVANTLNVFGFRKEFFDASCIESLPAGLKIVAALQTILGTILLFLIGLGIRNKFRMK